MTSHKVLSLSSSRRVRPFADQDSMSIFFFFFMWNIWFIDESCRFVTTFSFTISLGMEWTRMSRTRPELDQNSSRTQAQPEQNPSKTRAQLEHNSSRTQAQLEQNSSRTQAELKHNSSRTWVELEQKSSRTQAKTNMFQIFSLDPCLTSFFTTYEYSLTHELWKKDQYRIELVSHSAESSIALVNFVPSHHMIYSFEAASVSSHDELWKLARLTMCWVGSRPSHMVFGLYKKKYIQYYVYT